MTTEMNENRITKKEYREWEYTIFRYSAFQMFCLQSSYSVIN